MIFKKMKKTRNQEVQTIVTFKPQEMHHGHDMEHLCSMISQ
jgi:hypothetical protein